MEEKIEDKVKVFMDEVISRNGHEPEFIQAVQEVAETVIPYIVQHDIYHGKKHLVKNGGARAIDFVPGGLGR